MTTEHEALALVVDDPADAGQRADVILGRHLPGISRRIARTLGLEGKLLLDGHRCPPSTRVPLGAKLSLRLTVPEATEPVTVLARTERFVYVGKPAGTHTHRLRPDGPPTLADAVALVHPECAHASPEPRQGGAVHRLDRDTTGVVAFARSLDAWRAARRAFGARRVLKAYRACVLSGPDPWPPPQLPLTDEPPPIGPWPAPSSPGVSIAAALGPAGRHRVTVREDGRPALTLAWRILHDDPGRLELLLSLITGHRHQARAHLAWIGHPIVGDAAYGGPSSPAMRLHAAAIDLRAAHSDEPVVHAPLPAGWGDA